MLHQKRVLASIQFDARSAGIPGYWYWSVPDVRAEPLFQELTHQVRLRRLHTVELAAEILQFGARCLADAGRDELAPPRDGA